MSNLQIVERHFHRSMPVSYAPYGQDATVSYGSYDLRFKNNTDFPLLIWTQAIDNILYIGFYGKNSPQKVQWHHEITDIKKTTTIYKPNPKLPPGAKKLVIIGGDGAKVKSWVTIEQPNGSVITKNLGKSHYLPLPYIYEVGSEKK
jgi:vancomycin resistance protein VanW